MSSTAPALSHGAAGPWVRACPGCGLSQHVPVLADGMAGRCRRCGTVLRHAWPRALAFAQAAAFGAVPLLAVGSTQTLALVDKAGRQRTADLLDGPLALAQHGMGELAALVGIVTMVMPGLVIGLFLATLFGIRHHRGAAWVARVFAWRNRLKPWAMIDVFLVGYFVAYTKLGALVHVEVGPGFWALAAFMVATVSIDGVLDSQAVWDEIGLLDPPPAHAASPAAHPGEAGVSCHVCGLACVNGEKEGRKAFFFEKKKQKTFVSAMVRGVCPRCATGLIRRKPNAITYTAALGIAGLLMYIPANILPVLTVMQLGSGSPSTIIGGVSELAQAGQWPLAAIVFSASIAVPVLKILVLGALLWAAAYGPVRPLRSLATLYRVVMVIGRWSMIDIFMESILSALVQFGTVAEVDPGPGAVPFAAVVVLTMLAAERFDPRLIWDRARA